MNGTSRFERGIAVVFSSVHATDIPNVKVVSCYDADTCRVNLPRSVFNDNWAYQLFGHNSPLGMRVLIHRRFAGSVKRKRI